MDDIVHLLDIQGKHNDRFVTCFVKLFYGVEYSNSSMYYVE